MVEAVTARLRGLVTAYGRRTAERIEKAERDERTGRGGGDEAGA